MRKVILFIRSKVLPEDCTGSQLLDFYSYVETCRRAMTLLNPILLYVVGSDATNFSLHVQVGNKKPVPIEMDDYKKGISYALSEGVISAVDLDLSQVSLLTYEHDGVEDFFCEAKKSRPARIFRSEIILVQ